MPISLPLYLQKEIASLCASLSPAQLAAASRELSHEYKKKQSNPFFHMPLAHRMAYITARMPATYGAVSHALHNTTARYPMNPKSLLDIGAGTGAGLWAACTHFSQLQHLTALERHAPLAQLGQQLCPSVYATNKPKVEWRLQDAQKEVFTDSFDFVLLAYSLSEMPQRMAVLEKAWMATKQCLLIVEPGTPEHYQNILQMRNYLLKHEAHIIAPCPHSLRCPLGPNDWCHFSVRIERSFAHRRAKSAHLPYEDEKFCYLAVAKQAPIADHKARILRNPEIARGHVRLHLCQANGRYEIATFSKKNKELFRQAKKSSWGSSL